MGWMEGPEYRKLAAEQPGAVLLETSRAIAGRPGRGLFFTKPVQLLTARRLEEVPMLFAAMEEARRNGFWLAGYLGYECGYHFEPTAAAGYEDEPDGPALAEFGVYREPIEFAVEQDDVRGAEEAQTHLAVKAEMQIMQAAFAEKVAAIRRAIERGESYQANLTDRVAGIVAKESAGSHAADGVGRLACQLFGQMMRAQPVEFGALLHLGGRHILSASPELFFRLQGKHITVCPMKGTAARGRDAAEDAARATALELDAKNRAENVMIVDLLRSDLGRIAKTGSVRVERLFAVERLPSLLQMTSTVTAELREEVDLYALFRALFPSGSIVGAPKVQTMRLLRELERRARGVYCGAIGFVSPKDEAVFSVAIRTVVLQQARMEMGVGAGITYDSVAEAEYAECVLKAAFLHDTSRTEMKLIETMRWENGQCALLGEHLDRLEASARYFAFAMDRHALETALRRHAGAWQAGAYKIRLTLDHAGSFALGEPERLEPNPLHHEPGALCAMLWTEPVHSEDRFLRHKTTRRQLYDDAVKVARERQCVDAIFVNERGEVTEGAIHTVFVRHGAEWRTAPLDAGVLPGVYRAKLLREMPEVREATFSVEELLAADEVWLTNAVRGVRRVKILRDGVQLPR